MLRWVAGWSRWPAAARAQGAFFALVAAAGLVVACAAGVWFVSLRGADLEVHLVGVAGAVVLGAVWLSVFSTLSDLSAQHARDLEAHALFDTLKRGERPRAPYALYLRPFSSTNVILEDMFARQTFGANVFVAASTSFELEQQIEYAARRIGRLVALGEPLEHIGAGRIRIGEDGWQDAVKLLSDSAELIVLLPSSRPGTLWEVERLLDTGLITRTVIVDPPNAPGARPTAYEQGSEWAQVRAAFARRGYVIPEDSRHGQLLYFGRERSVTVKAQLDLDAEENIERFFRRVLKLRTKLAHA